MRIRLISGFSAAHSDELVRLAASVVAGTRLDPDEVILQILCPSLETRDAALPVGLQAALEAALSTAGVSGQAWLDVVEIPASEGPALAHFMGDVGGRLLRVGDDEIVLVLTGEGLGTAALQDALRPLAAMFDVAEISDQYRVASALEPRVVGSSLVRVQRATARVLAGQLDGSPLMAFTGQDGDHRLPSRALQSLLDPWAGNGTSLVSTCAVVLRKHSADGAFLANRLDTLMQHWERQHIWDASYVNEMVLHDESHSMSVDRNIALLCGPMLGDELNEYDFFVLALCAWLHDWGHASCLVGGRFPIDPMEVRNFHGALTSQRLLTRMAQHGLSEPNDEDLLKRVRLICAHHQGWTSCDDQNPNWRKVPPRKLSTIPENGLGLGLLRDQAIGSFDAEARDLLGTGDSEIQHLRRLLALFRVADASDVGRHRVPHALSRVDAHSELVSAYLERGYSVFGDDGRALLGDVNMGYLALLREIEGSLRPEATPMDYKSVERHALEVAKGYLRGSLKTLYEPNDPGLTPLVRFGLDAWDYAVHVAAQTAYFANHGVVRGVYPMIDEGKGVGGGRTLSLHVFRDEADHDRAITTIRADVLKEFGLDPDDKPDPLKRSIRSAFAKMGVQVDDFDSPNVKICSHAGAL